MRFYKNGMIIFLIFFCGNSVASPWFTGPLLAPSGQTIPRGHTNLETYAFLTNLAGIYTSFGQVITTPGNQSLIVNPLLAHGLSDTVDLQYSVPFTYNRNGDVRYKHIGDTSINLGYQLLSQHSSTWKPDLRISLQELIPTGKYNSLTPEFAGTDATGLGSYQTALGFNFQHLLPLFTHYYLRTRLSLVAVYAATTHLSGVSTYGGNALTRGSIQPGNLISGDFATELSINQNWVLVMEVFGSKRAPSRFKGDTGLNRNGIPDLIGHGLSKQLTIAPAIEYNFSPNIGIIAGIWKTLRGESSSDFGSAVIALNLYW